MTTDGHAFAQLEIRYTLARAINYRLATSNGLHFLHGVIQCRFLLLGVYSHMHNYLLDDRNLMHIGISVFLLQSRLHFFLIFGVESRFHRSQIILPKHPCGWGGRSSDPASSRWKYE